MGHLFIIWFVSSMFVFLAGLVLFRKGLRWKAQKEFESVKAVLMEREAEILALKKIHQDFVEEAERSLEEKNISISGLEEALKSKDLLLHETLVEKDEATALLRIECDKLALHLAEEKKYSAQSVGDYQEQIRTLDQMLTQLKSDHQIALHEKEMLLNKLSEERDIIAAQRDDFSKKTLALELKLEDALKAIGALKSDSVDFDPTDEDQTISLRKSIQKSVALIKELKADNDQLNSSNKDLKNQLNDAESVSRNLEEKAGQLQYELIKARAQLLGLEQICDDLKQKMELLAAR